MAGRGSDIARLRRSVTALIRQCTEPTAAAHAAIAAAALAQLGADVDPAPAAALLRRVSTEIDVATKLQREADAIDRKHAASDAFFAAYNEDAARDTI